MFVTKIDRSYRVQCFYAETSRTVTQNLNVRCAKSGRVQLDNREHTKEYETKRNLRWLVEQYEHNEIPVLAGGKDGLPLKFASVGEQVYHEWTCTTNGSTDDSGFCATVHSCNVREDGGREVQLLDENGCAVDRYLLNNLEYTSDLTGGQISQVFKFADQQSLYFQCQIRLSLKEGPVCKRSSDDCPKALRGKRSTEPDKNSVDVISQQMTVFEIDNTAGVDFKGKSSCSSQCNTLYCHMSPPNW
ncbi:unnamed protein product [Nippostrongylus brasiliensis]|uniref:ZP domain-containing protein n=1 Tax=Nippostrongylus brasiliensis TaxID=27835 RepID=A0A0N4Y6I9_NIPBR|nr:unnamed protein product [Nippostrongylus brasiliensis]